MTSDAPTMTVRVRDRDREAPWGSGLTNPVVRPITISARCPVCDGPRGEPTNLNQHEDGVWYSTDVWTNPCGHVDSYAAAVAEAARLAVEPWRSLNLAATFAIDDERDAGYTYVTIGGVVVFVYIQDGVLKVSLHFDEAEPPLLVDSGDESCVPVEVNLGGTVVYAIDGTGQVTEPSGAVGF